MSTIGLYHSSFSRSSAPTHTAAPHPHCLPPLPLQPPEPLLQGNRLPTITIALFEPNSITICLMCYFYCPPPQTFNVRDITYFSNGLGFLRISAGHRPPSHTLSNSAPRSAQARGPSSLTPCVCPRTAAELLFEPRAPLPLFISLVWALK